MKQCSRVGIPLEQKPLKLYIYDSWCSTSTNDFEALSLIKLRTLWIRKFPLENEDFSIYWYLTYRLQIAADGSSGLSQHRWISLT